MNAPLRNRVAIIVTSLAILIPNGGRAEEFRTFKNSAGKEVRAKVLSVTNGKASITLESGHQFEIPIASLSPADQEFLAKWAPGATSTPAPIPSTGGVTSKPTPLRPQAFGGKGAEGLKKEIPSGNTTMARLKFLLAFLAMLICFGGVAGAYFYWKKFAQPEIVVTRHISGKGDSTPNPLYPRPSGGRLRKE